MRFVFNLDINIRQRGLKIITAQVAEQDTSQHEDSNLFVLCGGVHSGGAGGARTRHQLCIP